MSVNSVIVRMYRKLLGDCFLIIVENDGKYSKTLVDCGILQGTPGGDEWMRKVVDNVYRSFGKKLDLVVVTHEHWDHISGFQHASKIFAEHKFDKLWMAWTEDPTDPQGQELQAKFSKAHVKLAALAAATGSTVGLMGFSGPLGADKKSALRGSKAIYENLRQWTKTKPQYFSPGMIDELPGGLKTYVLAPPRDTKHLFKALPSRGDAKETYLGLNPTDDELKEARSQSPFSPLYRWRSYKDIKTSEAKPTEPEGRVRDRYFRSGEDFDRSIDDRYGMELNRLALRMDSNTNNSSLVLAIELPDGSNMIFAADAQVGNWLSWGGVEFKDEDPEGTEQVITGHDLLARAKLYKVGHHGSHNATLKKDGLELMIRDDLVALISTDAKFALKQGKGWLMPNPNVRTALLERTKGRVVRGDELTSAGHAALAGMVREGKDELYVDVLAHGQWPADYQLQTGGA